MAVRARTCRQLQREMWRAKALGTDFVPGRREGKWLANTRSSGDAELPQVRCPLRPPRQRTGRDRTARACRG